MKFFSKIKSGIVFAILLAGSIVTVANAAPGDLYVQVDLESPQSGEACSIMRVAPDGTLSEWVSNADILAVTGDSSSDFSDTGMAIRTDGTIYFAEDVSNFILVVDPGGNVATLVTEANIIAATGETTADIDNGMVFGSDGFLYVADEDSNSVLQIDPDTKAITVVVTEAEIIAGTGKGGADLEGGIARQSSGTLYLADDYHPDSIVMVTSAGVVSNFITEAAITAVTGNSSADLDVAIALSDYLYVLDDAGSNDAVLRVDTASAVVSLVAGASNITAVTGLDTTDLEGGLAIDAAENLFIGDDGEDSSDTSLPNIIRIDPSDNLSLFVSESQITSFYSPLYPGFTYRLRGSMVIQPLQEESVSVPTLSEWGKLLTILLIGSISLIASRRRRHTAL